MPTARRFVLLDRDGTINVERHYLSHPDQLELLPNAAAGLRHLQQLGLGLAVVTNQSGVGRGYFELAAVDAVHDRLREMLAAEGVSLDGVFVCPHTDADGCDCRKPLPGMALRAAQELGFEPARAFVIGDKAVDVDLGRAMGATTFLVTTGHGATTLAAGEARPDYVVADLGDAARCVEALLRGSAALI